jgi:hypothetical protein
MDPHDLRKHQDFSAAEAEKFLRSKHADKSLVDKVKTLIAHHEEGGDEEQNILCDADCLTYFEHQALRHAKTFREQGKTKEEMQKKFEHVFARISSQKAKEIAQPWYEEALAELELQPPLLKAKQEG